MTDSNNRNIVMQRFLISICFLVFLSLPDSHAQETATVKFEPEEMNFPTVLYSTCRPKKIEATNVSNTAIENPGFTVEGDPEFSVQQGFRKCPTPLEPGETCRVYVDFCPQAHQSYSASLVFAESDNIVPMAGRGSAGGSK
jgi:hypothetical protein